MNSTRQTAPRQESSDALEIHDVLTQQLFSASLIADVLPRIWDLNPEEGRVRLNELRVLTQDMLVEMERLLHELQTK